MGERGYKKFIGEVGLDAGGCMTMQNMVIAPVTEIRVTDVPIKIKEDWEAAAKRQGMSLTDFLITAANDAVEKGAAEQSRLELSTRDQVQVAETLLNPPPLNEPMRQALRKHHEYMTKATKESLQECWTHERSVDDL